MKDLQVFPAMLLQVHFNPYSFGIIIGLTLNRPLSQKKGKLLASAQMRCHLSTAKHYPVTARRNLMQIVELSWSKNTSSFFSLTENDRSLLGLKMQLYCLKGFFLVPVLHSVSKNWLGKL